ncbi:MAG: hypothetical protein K2X27_13690 [Candidatus Obscuribacterales bacterium]|nr:hypothetical protein [Candidatus Obscuribacterales bacterium]
MAKEKEKAALDKDALLKDVPLMAKPVAGAMIDWLNKLDLNHDGVSDLAQFAPIAASALPVVAKLAESVDWEKLLHAYCKDGSKTQAIIAEIKEVAGIIEKAVGK